MNLYLDDVLLPHEKKTDIVKMSDVLIVIFLCQKKIVVNKIESWSFHSFYCLKISNNH